MKELPNSPLSLWLDSYGTYSPNQALQGDISVDVAIIGGGFTGMTLAYELRRADPSLRVAVLEAKTVGYGASGRNGSFAMTVVGLGFGTTAMMRGRKFLKRAHRYMMQAVDTLDELILREKLDCDRIRPGFLRTALTRGHLDQVQHDVKLMRSLGFDDIFYMSGEEVRAKVDSPHYLGAIWEPRLVLINPAKLVRAEKELALRTGAFIYENTPVLQIAKRPDFRLKTPQGNVTAKKIAFATNAYSHLFPQLRSKQSPAFTYMIATEPLTPAQLDPIGWQGMEGVEDARNLVHYYRLTPDKRFVLGGGPVGLTFNNSLNGDSSPSNWKHLENYMSFLFPSLKGVKITHRWGGPFSVTLNLAPALGFVGDRRAVYSLGCLGHGVSMSHLNAQILCDLLLERDCDSLDCPFLNAIVIPAPPEPLRLLTAAAIRSCLQLEDWSLERELPRH